MAWVFILTTGAAVFVLLLLLLLRLHGRGPKSGTRTRGQVQPPIKPSRSPSNRLSAGERKELLANARAAAQADPHRTAQLIREWMSNPLEDPEK